MAFAMAPATTSTPLPSSSTQTTPDAFSSWTSPRSLRQLGLFFGGACFFGVSSLITRRSLVRKYKSSIPKFYQPSNRPNADVNGALEAFEALNVATINVLSTTMMAAGGLLWAFDISSLEDMRVKIRGGLGIDGVEGRESRADEEMEEWLASVLARKEQKVAAKKYVEKANKKDEE